MLIVGCVLLLHTLDQTPRLTPLLISKANTVMQLILGGIVLADLGLVIAAPGIVPALVLATAATTLISGGAYLVGWGRSLIGGK